MLMCPCLMVIANVLDGCDLVMPCNQFEQDHVSTGFYYFLYHLLLTGHISGDRLVKTGSRASGNSGGAIGCSHSQAQRGGTA